MLMERTRFETELKEILNCHCIDGSAKLETAERNGLSLIHIFARRGDVECLAACLDQGADPNHVWDGETALIEAVDAGGPDAIRLLLMSGADPNAKGVLGLTAEELLERKISTMKSKKRGAYVALLDEMRAKSVEATGDLI